jgi:hypothetical protein
MKKVLFSLFFGAIMTGCFGQQVSKNLSLSDFTFKSYLGIYKTDSSNIYSLLGDFLFPYHSDNSDSLIEDWIVKHPKAIVIPICISSAENNIKITQCWLVDCTDTINNYLVRNGCFSAEKMRRPQTWKELTRKEKSFYKRIDKPEITILIDPKSYANYMEQINIAEKLAIDELLGIWNYKLNNK